MRKAILIEVKVYDESSLVVEKHIVRHYEGAYGFEIERVFERLGERLAKEIDPSHGL